MRIQSVSDTMWDDVDSLVGAEYTYTTGFSENWQASLGNFIDENQSISELIHTAPYRERNDALREMISSGVIKPDEITPFRVRNNRAIDYNRLGDYVAAKDPNSGIRLTEEIEKEMQADLATRREYYEDVRAKANWAGDVGAFAGMAQGAVLDPVIAAGFVIGPTAAVNSANFMRSFGYTAGRFGSYAAGEEALIQAQVAQWKERIDSPYTIADVVTNIAGAGAGGALVGAGAAAINRFLSGGELPEVEREAFQEWLQTADGVEAQKAVQRIEEELNDAPDSNMTVQQFSDDMQAEHERFNRIESPDPELQPKLEDIEEDQFFDAVDTDLNTRLQQEEVDLEVPSFKPDGEVQTTALRTELENINADSQRMQQLRDCLIG